MRVKPVTPGAVIRDPETKRLLPDEGGEVPESSFWIRRLRAFEVVRIDDQEQPAPAVLAPVAPLTTR